MPAATEGADAGAVGVLWASASIRPIRAPENLSGGESARLLLALAHFSRAASADPDEPTNHLDVDSREALVRTLIDDYEGAVSPHQP